MMIPAFLKCSTCGDIIPSRAGHRLHEHCKAPVLGIYYDYVPVVLDASITPGMFRTSEALRCDDEAAP